MATSISTHPATCKDGAGRLSVGNGTDYLYMNEDDLEPDYFVKDELAREGWKCAWEDHGEQSVMTHGMN